MRELTDRNHTSPKPLCRAKRLTAAIVALLLILSFSTVALADSGAYPGGSPRAGSQQGRSPQESPDPSASGSGMQNGQGEGMHNAEMNSITLEKIAEAISDLTDEAAKETLLALLDAYETALDAKQAAVVANDTADLSSLSTAVADAKAALDTALEAAGIVTEELYGVPELALDGTGRTENRPALNTDEISATIEALDDTEETKAALSALLGVYEDALKAQNGANVSKMTQEQIGLLQDATNKAEQALMEALKNAGLSEEPIREQNRQQVSANQPETVDENQYQFSVISEGTASGDGGTTSIFSAFFQWLNSIFK